MDDDTQPMEAIREPWSVAAWDYASSVGFGYVSIHSYRVQDPWKAYFAPIDRGQSSFEGWFVTAEDAKAAIDVHADQLRALQDARVTS